VGGARGRHAFTAAAIVGGLRSAAALASRHEPALVERYEARGRAGARRDRARALERLPRALQRSLGDPTLDVSLLGLGVAVRGGRSGRRPRCGRRSAALQAELGCPRAACAVRGDTYAGGNRWVLAALWLGLWYRQVGERHGLERH
jgi:hypothetical protein